MKANKHFLCIAQLFLEWEIFPTNVEKIKTRSLRSVTP